MATIYNSKPLPNAGNDGQSITISVLARSNISLADVAAYRSFFGLPNNAPNIIVVGSDPGLNSDDVEASLDVEMASALATGAKVDFIVSSASLVGRRHRYRWPYAVDNNIGDIIPLSYGGCEANDGAAVQLSGTFSGNKRQRRARRCSSLPVIVARRVAMPRILLSAPATV